MNCSPIPRFLGVLLLLAAPALGLEVQVSFGPELRAEPVDGRLLLILSTDDEREPRFQVSGDTTRTMQLFGIDVEGLAPGAVAVVGEEAFGHPVRRLADVPAGDYFVQAVLHRYDTFARGDGHTVVLPASWAAGQQWNREPGNLYSTPRQVRVDPAAAEPIELRLDRVIPPIEPPADTKYIRHLRMRSPSLSEFWGRDMFLGAHVLVPEGFDDHPDARYPLMIFHGHYPGGLRRLPHRAAGPGPRVRVLRALPARLLQPDPAAGGLRLLSALDLARDAARPDRRDPARESLLRRLLRRQLGQPGALRRRHHLRAGARDRAPLPRPRRGLGALPLRRLDRRLGGAGGAGLLPRRVQRRLRRLPRPDRLPRLHPGGHLPGRQRLRRARTVRRRRAAGTPRLPRADLRHPARLQHPGAGQGIPGPLRRPVRHLGGGLLAGGRGRLPASGCGTSSPARSTPRWPSSGRSTTSG